MRRFGVALGLAALVHLLGLWGVPFWRDLLFFPAFALSWAVVRLWQDSATTAGVRGLKPTATALATRWRSDDSLPYAAWAVATLLVLSTGDTGLQGQVLWVVATIFSAGLLPAGVLFTRGAVQRGRSVDLAFIAWSVPATVAALLAPPWVPDLFRLVLGWAGAVGMAAVLLTSLWRVVQARYVQATRSPWYGLGGSAVLGQWIVAATPPWFAHVAVTGLALMALLWAVVVLLAHRLGTQGAWANLFSLCSMAMLALDLHLRDVALVFTGAALLSFAFDSARTLHKRVVPMLRGSENA